MTEHLDIQEKMAHIDQMLVNKMVFMLALFGFAIALGLFCLAMIGAVLTLALRVLGAVLWIIVKVVEHRSATSPVIEIIIEDQDRPMRDVTSRKATRHCFGGLTGERGQRATESPATEETDRHRPDRQMGRPASIRTHPAPG